MTDIIHESNRTWKEMKKKPSTIAYYDDDEDIIHFLVKIEDPKAYEMIKTHELIHAEREKSNKKLVKIRNFFCHYPRHKIINHSFYFSLFLCIILLINAELIKDIRTLLLLSVISLVISTILYIFKDFIEDLDEKETNKELRERLNITKKERQKLLDKITGKEK